MLTQKDIDQLEKQFREIFATKEELQEVKSDIMGVLDKILKEVVTTRETVTIVTHQVKGHTDRLEKLEDIHPGGKHAHVAP